MNRPQRRLLGGMERQFLHHNTIGSTNFCSVLFVEGALDLSLLTDALDLLLVAYPQLLYKIVAEPRHHYAPAHEGAKIAYRVVDRMDPEHWRCVVEKEIIRSHQEARIFVTVLKGGMQSEIVVSLDHTLADGRSGYSICRFLIDAWNGLAPEPQAFGGAIEDRLPKRYRGLAGFLRSLHFLWKKSRIVPKLSHRFGDITPTQLTFTDGIRLDQADTAALKKQAVSEGSNLNAAICAATLLAAFELDKAEIATIALNTPTCLRTQLEPAALPHELGMFVSGLLHWHKVDRKTAAWPLARNILQALRAGVGAGESLMLSRLVGSRKGPPVDRKPRQFSPSISVTNIGAIETLPDIGSAKVTAYRTLVSIWPQDSITVVIVGYDDALIIDVHTSANKFCDEPNYTQRLSGALKHRLIEMGRGGRKSHSA